jgi:hypothetical protein
MLNVDLTRAARSHAERLALVQAVAAAPAHEPETDWIEWKSALDVSSTEGSFAIARGILGFGNRDPAFAARFARGCAYFLVGVEAGAVVGVTPHDSADIEQWLGRYIAPHEPQWSVDYIVAGQAVMLITVEAPQWGDDIFTLQRGFDKTKAASVFVRLNGKTDFATVQDMRRLTERAKRSDLRLNVAVDWRDSPTLKALALPEAEARQWAARERERLDPRELPVTNRAGGYGLMQRETRKPAEFTAEVQRYLPTAPARFRLLAQKAAVETGLAKVELVLENHTDLNFAQTQVTLRLPADVSAHFDGDELAEELDQCDPPLPWGKHTIDRVIALKPLHALVERLRPDGRAISRDEHELVVTLPALDVRPGTRHELTAIALVIPESYVGRTLEVAWRATSTGAAGDVSGTLETVIGTAVAVAEVLGSP